MAYESMVSASTNETGLEKATAALRAFVHNPGLDELARLYGADMAGYDVAQRLTTLGSIAASHWDIRKGAERQATDWNHEKLSQEGSEEWNAVFEAATKLGMVESSSPKNRTPDYLVILGGANRAPLDRLRYGLEQVDDFGQLVYVGSGRGFTLAERQIVKQYAPYARNEFEIGWGMFETFLGATMLRGVLYDENGWGITSQEFDGVNAEKKKAFALDTPPMTGDDRANTYDNYRFLAETIGLAHHSEASIVSVTTGFYTQAQHAPALQEITLPYGVTVETIGHDAAYSGAHRLPTHLLQETKAAVDGYKRLYDATMARGAGQLALEDM